jgi:hypothetical protein
MSILSTAHYTAFGLITHCYASVEFGIKAGLGGVLEIPLLEAMIVTEPYSAATLKNVAKSLIKDSALTESHRERFIYIIGDWSAFSPLRNQIAHCRWERGDREGAVRAVGLDIRSGTAKWIVSEGTRDWTAKELHHEALKLSDINARLQQLHADAGLHEIMAEKESDKSARIRA